MDNKVGEDVIDDEAGGVVRNEEWGCSGKNILKLMKRVIVIMITIITKKEKDCMHGRTESLYLGMGVGFAGFWEACECLYVNRRWAWMHAYFRYTNFIYVGMVPSSSSTTSVIYIGANCTLGNSKAFLFFC